MMLTVTRPEFEKVKSNVRLLKYETNILDQSSRKDNFKIHNLVKSEDEVTITDSVVNLMNAILSPGVGYPHSAFLRKRKLMNIDNYIKDVFLIEDRMSLRLKLKTAVKDVHGTSIVHSKDDFVGIDGAITDNVFDFKTAAALNRNQLELLSFPIERHRYQDLIFNNNGHRLVQLCKSFEVHLEWTMWVGCLCWFAHL